MSVIRRTKRRLDKLTARALRDGLFRVIICLIDRTPVRRLDSLSLSLSQRGSSTNAAENCSFGRSGSPSSSGHSLRRGSDLFVHILNTPSAGPLPRAAHDENVARRKPPRKPNPHGSSDLSRSSPHDLHRTVFSVSVQLFECVPALPLFVVTPRPAVRYEMLF